MKVVRKANPFYF